MRGSKWSYNLVQLQPRASILRPGSLNCDVTYVDMLQWSDFMLFLCWETDEGLLRLLWSSAQVIHLWRNALTNPVSSALVTHTFESSICPLCALHTTSLHPSPFPHVSLMPSSPLPPLSISVAFTSLLSYVLY